MTSPCLHQFSSVQFSCPVVSDSLRPHGSQHTRPPCPSPTPGVYPNSCPLNRWCHAAILSFVLPFSSCSQSLPVQGTRKNLLQHHSSKVSILLHSAFFIVELGNPEIDPHIWIILGFLTTKVWFIYWLYSWSACRIRSVKEDSMRDKIALIASDSTAWVHMNI